MKMSRFMSLLYGEKRAEKVYQRLEFLHSDLNEDIQKIAYDYFWALPGLSLRDKSIVTISSLIAIKKEEQTRIHMHGFLNMGGKINKLILITQNLEILCGDASNQKALEAYEKFIGMLSATVAIGKPELMQNAIKDCLNNGFESQLSHIFRHQIVYCGFPSVMNAFAEYRNVLNMLGIIKHRLIP